LVRAHGNKERLLPERGESILYLGAGHGTTISHLHDLICGERGEEGGRIIAVDLSPRCLRDLNHLASTRPGILPILADARMHSRWGMMLPHKINWMLQDVSQAGQAAMFLEAAHRCLASGGTALLSLKAASERWSDEGEKALFVAVEEELEQGGLIVEEVLNLHGLQDNHRMFVTRMP
jgi:fibrillarin-like rRNA methylase